MSPNEQQERVPNTRLSKSCEKPRSGGRTQLEDRERAFIAASRRSDRSAEARLQSAHKASEVHYQRTGRRLKVTPQIVEAGEQYESEDDIATKRIKVRRPGLIPETASSYVTGHAGVCRIADEAELCRREQAVDCEFMRVFPQFQQQQKYALSFHHLGAQGLASPSYSTAPYSSQHTFATNQCSSIPQSQSPVPYSLDGWRDMRRQSAPLTHISCDGEQPSAYSRSPGSPMAFSGFASPRPQRPPTRSASVGTPLGDRHTPELSWNSSSGTPSMTPSSSGSPLDFPFQRTGGQADPNIDPILVSELPSDIKDIMGADGLGIEDSEFSVGCLSPTDLDGIGMMKIQGQDSTHFAANSSVVMMQNQQEYAYMLDGHNLSDQGTHNQQRGMSQLPVYQWPRGDSLQKSSRDMDNDVQFDEFVHSEGP